KEIVPLMTIDYNLDLHLDNTASLPEKVDGTIPIKLRVDHQPGAAKIPIEYLKMWVSYNDGEDWVQIDEISRDGSGEFTADLIDLKDNREGNGYVSMKIEAEDKKGNRLEQKVLRVYKWNFEGDINGDDMIDIHDVIRAIAF